MDGCDSLVMRSRTLLVRKVPHFGRTLHVRCHTLMSERNYEGQVPSKPSRTFLRVSLYVVAKLNDDDDDADDVTNFQDFLTNINKKILFFQLDLLQII